MIRNFIFTAILLAAIPINVAASELLFVKQFSDGRFMGCGPIQCVMTKYDTQAKVIDLVTNDIKHTNIRPRGQRGSCMIYYYDGHSRSDRTREWMDERIAKNCN